jgi:hypothetical protein
MLQAYTSCLVAAQSDGTALTNSTSETSIIPALSKITLPANFFQFIGQQILLKASGRISNVVTTPGTLLFNFYLGSVIAAASGALNLNTTAKTNVTWDLEWLMTCRAVGASTSANLMHTGKFQSESVVGSAANTAGGNGSLNIPVSAPAVGTGWDSTASQVIDLKATFSVSTATTSIQVHQFSLLSLL